MAEPQEVVFPGFEDMSPFQRAVFGANQEGVQPLPAVTDGQVVVWSA